MRSTSYFILITVLTAMAHTVQAQTPTCQTVQFSESVIERFPRLREACLDVIERQGQQLAVFKADLLKVSGNKVRMRAKLPNGTHAEAQTVQVNPQRRVLIDGKNYRVNQLALGQELTIYVKVDEPLATIAPADAAEPVELMPVETESTRVASAEPEMPRTASPLPLLGLLGVVLMCGGFVLGCVRHARHRRSVLPA